MANCFRFVVVMMFTCFLCAKSMVAAPIPTFADFLFSEQEHAFIDEAIANQAVVAVWNDGRGGRLHCFFGLDTVMWRSGRMDSLFWGRPLGVGGEVTSRLSGVYVDAFAWMFRGKLNVLGRSSWLAAENDWLVCDPISGWSSGGPVAEWPSLPESPRIVGLDNNEFLAFGMDNRVFRSNPTGAHWTELGRVTEKFTDFLGDFDVLDVGEFALFFGELGGGILKKSTMRFVTNYDLRSDVVRTARGWYEGVDGLEIVSEGPDGKLLNLTYDAESMFGSAASLDFVVPMPEKLGFLSDLDDRARGVLWGWASGGIVLLMLWMGRRLMVGGATTQPGSLPPKVVSSNSEAPSAGGKEVQVLSSAEDAVGNGDVVQEGKEPITTPGPENGPKGLTVDVEGSRRSVDRGARPESRRRPQKKVARNSREVSGPEAPVNEGPSSVADRVYNRLLNAADDLHTAAELNLLLGIEPESSEESKRARRARMVRVLNEMHMDRVGRKLISRERDPKDRRHLLYRINRQIG